MQWKLPWIDDKNGLFVVNNLFCVAFCSENGTIEGSYWGVKLGNYQWVQLISRSILQPLSKSWDEAFQVRIVRTSWMTNCILNMQPNIFATHSRLCLSIANLCWMRSVEPNTHLVSCQSTCSCGHYYKSEITGALAWKERTQLLISTPSSKWRNLTLCRLSKP